MPTYDFGDRLSFFVTLYPDELLYSGWARFIERLNISPPRQYFHIFGRQSYSKRFILPANISAFVRRLSIPQVYSIQYLIQHHTLFPFYRYFLRAERANKILQYMITGKGKCIIPNYYKIEALTFARYCPKCFQEDITQYGEPYWHRMHQIAGINLCKKHNCWLENSTLPIRSRSLSGYKSARTVIDVISPPRFAPTNTYSKLQTYYAQQASHLLLDRKPVFLDNLRKRYTTSLFAENLASYEGRVYAKQVKAKLIDKYSPEVLKLLDCDFRSSTSSWVLYLTNDSASAISPIVHLLLWHFLGYNAPDIPDYPERPAPFGPGPWPCLNPVCLDYHKSTIDRVEIQTRNRRVYGTFKCKCGYIYNRIGPDTTESDIYKKISVRAYGDLWWTAFNNMVAEQKSFYQIGKILGISRGTVVSYYESGCHQRRKKPTKKQNPSPKDRESYRKKWLEHRNVNPGATRTDLCYANPGLYTWLQKYDEEWLFHNSPPRVRRSTRRETIDWEARDETFYKRINQIVKEILNSPERPKRISKTRICRQLGERKSLKKHDELRLPRTARLLSEVEESYEDCALRRVSWAANQFIAKGFVPSRSKFIRFVTLDRWKDDPVFQAAIDQALEKIRVEVQRSKITEF